ncbi:MAG: hypothetical protein Q9M92_14345 [Enterobacterales bacterium]|nr:hypothetical protein [Enterobacterales bacterium]
MNKLGRILFIAKFSIAGTLVAWLWLFFMANSPLNFNWHQLQQAWQFYQQSSHQTTSNSTINTFQLSYAEAIEKAGPSVVSVKAIRRGRARPRHRWQGRRYVA